MSAGPWSDAEPLYELQPVERPQAALKLACGHLVEAPPGRFFTFPAAALCNVCREIREAYDRGSSWDHW